MSTICVSCASVSALRCVRSDEPSLCNRGFGIRWFSEKPRFSVSVRKPSQHYNIVRALMDLNGEKVCWPSEVEDDASTLYVGSFCMPYLVCIRFDQ